MIVTLLINGSMQQLFGMIRALQMIVIQGLIRIPLPGHTLEFFKGCMIFAQTDVFDGESYYDQWFEFEPTNPVNENYILLGIGDSNFIFNSGSYFIIFGGLFTAEVIKYSFNRLLVFGARYFHVRKVGIWLNRGRVGFDYSVLKLTLETHLDMCLATFMMIYAFIQHEDGF